MHEHMYQSPKRGAPGQFGAPLTVWSIFAAELHYKMVMCFTEGHFVPQNCIPRNIMLLSITECYSDKYYFCFVYDTMVFCLIVT